MALTVTHAKVSAIAPIPAPTGVVTPTDWNANHTLSGTAASSQGGTGQSVLTANAVLLGEGLGNNVGFAVTGTSGAILIDQGSGHDPAFTVMSGDGSVTSSGALTVTKTNGAAFTSYATAVVGQLPGTTTNDNASTGDIGEYLSASASASNLGNNVQTNFGSVSLTAGDWDVWCSVAFINNNSSSTVVTQALASLSTTSATVDTGSPERFSYLQITSGTPFTFPQNALVSAKVGPRRISISSSATIYCVAFATWSNGNFQAESFVSARRVR